ncbi:MAG: hypothetical protein K0S44_700 [Bacteroidetes bacterium]|jgi:hypothetical protein|nr:hypothetical protein [Bacteroidota bacterium]
MKEQTKTTDWNATKEKLLIKFSMLTNNDLQELMKKQDEMLLKIQTKLGKTKEEIQKLLTIKEENMQNDIDIIDYNSLSPFSTK